MIRNMSYNLLYLLLCTKFKYRFDFKFMQRISFPDDEVVTRVWSYNSTIFS